MWNTTNGLNLFIMKERILLITIVLSSISIVLGAMLKVMGVKIIASFLLVFGSVIIISSIILLIIRRKKIKET